MWHTSQNSCASVGGSVGPLIPSITSSTICACLTIDPGLNAIGPRAIAVVVYTTAAVAPPQLLYTSACAESCDHSAYFSIVVYGHIYSNNKSYTSPTIS